MTCTAKRFSDDDIVKTIVNKKLSFSPFFATILTNKYQCKVHALCI